MAPYPAEIGLPAEHQDAASLGVVHEPRTAEVPG